MRNALLIIAISLTALILGACGCPDCGTAQTEPAPLAGGLSLTANVEGGGSVTLPLRGVVNVTIDWGDGAGPSCPTRVTTPGNVTCRYTSGGSKTITVSRVSGSGASLSQFGSGAQSYPNAASIQALNGFGNLGIQSLSGAFNGASNLTEVPDELPEEVTDTSHMFAGASSFNQNLSGWNTGGVGNLNGMFNGATSFNNGCAAGSNCPLNWVINPDADTDGMFTGADAFPYADSLFGAKDPNQLTLSDYRATGITSVDASNLAAINSLLSGLGAGAQASVAALQALIDAYAALVAVVEGESEGLSAEELATLGLTALATPPSDAKRALFNSALKPPRILGTVDSYAEQQALASVVSRIINSTANDEVDASITKADFDSLGLNTASVSGPNIGAIREAIANASVESVSTLTGLQGVIDAAIAGGTITISNLTIGGVTPPAAGATPVSSVSETDQYTGTVTWSPSDTTFAAGTSYTATITLTPKAGYTLSGVVANSFTVAGATVTHAAGSGVLTAVFNGGEGDGGGGSAPTLITITAIAGVTPPVAGAAPVSSITDTAQYSGTVTWSPSDATFAAGSSYTATITLTPKTGYTLTGVAANSFTVAGATATNAADSGVITATFPAIISITAILGVTPPAAGATPVTGITESAQYTGTVSWSPSDATFAAGTSYTATITLTPKTGFTLNGVAANSFTVGGATTVTHAAGSGIVTATFSTVATPVSAFNLTGVTPPVAGATPVTSITDTAQYTGSVTWSPSDATFRFSTSYTATITLTAKSGFTFAGVAANSFSVTDATSVSNPANSGVVTATFPATAVEVGSVTALSAGNQHTCALNSGSVYCWGRNGERQLGNDSAVASFSTPQKVSSSDGFLNTSVTDFAAGLRHTCAVESGTVYCWGSQGGVNGNLGVGDFTVVRTAPTKVLPVAGVFSNTNVTAVGAAQTHTCAIEGWSVYCWGWQNNGVLGNGVNTGAASAPVKVSATDGFTNASVTKISVGQYHVCALEAGSVYCWGRNMYGQLGNGTETASFVPVKAVANNPFNNTSVTDISVGNEFTCALENQALYCWGWNDRYQLGQGSNTTIKVTKAVAVSTTNFGTNTPTVVNSGFDSTHSCTLVGGTAYCWGTQWGLSGSSIPSLQRPTLLDSGGGFVNSAVSILSLGGQHSCLLKEGNVFCWGEQSEGKLGNNTNSNTLIPVKVTFP